jgi:hypothetical protein
MTIGSNVLFLVFVLFLVCFFGGGNVPILLYSLIWMDGGLIDIGPSVLDICYFMATRLALCTVYADGSAVSRSIPSLGYIFVTEA